MIGRGKIGIKDLRNKWGIELVIWNLKYDKLEIKGISTNNISSRVKMLRKCRPLEPDNLYTSLQSLGNLYTSPQSYSQIIVNLSNRATFNLPSPTIANKLSQIIFNLSRLTTVSLVNQYTANLADLASQFTIILFKRALLNLCSQTTAKECTDQRKLILAFKVKDLTQPIEDIESKSECMYNDDWIENILRYHYHHGYNA